MRMYVHTPQFYVRPRNTDWLYSHLLKRLTEFNPELEVYLQQSLLCSVAENLRKGAEIVTSRSRLPIPVALRTKTDSYFSRGDVRRAKADFIYGQSPTNIEDVPVVFNCGPTYPDVLRSMGEPESFIARELKVKRRCADRATLVTSNSRANLENLAEIMPEHVGKMHCLPFFLPHLTALPDSEIAAKFTAVDKLQCLFVGREARRKALPEVLAAFLELSAKFPGKLHLKIVTNFADGAVEVPDQSNIELLGETSRSDVQRLLERSHLLLVPSHFESYGWIYLEAMAAGCIPVASAGATQREILADGRAGIAVAADAMKIQDALTPFLLHPEMLLPMAMTAAHHCRNEYFPDVIANRFEELGKESVALFRSFDKLCVR